jgi:PAS domain S-box-containing protein
VFIAEAGSGVILFSNRYAERVVGRPLSELAGDFPMFHLDGRPYEFAERQVPRSIIAAEEIVDEEFFGPAFAGGRVRYRCSSWPVYDDGGRLVAAVAVTRDVTEQRRQEEGLAYLAGMLENTEDGVVAMNEGYVLTVWNKGAERLYGWKAAEVIGLHADEVARTNLTEEERTELRRELAETGRWRGEVTVARKDGTRADVELVSVAVRGRPGAITGYLTIHRDISDRKRAEAALRASQRRSETILESISDDFFAVDRQWRYTYVNERALAQARRAAGRDITREELSGMTLWKLLPQHVGTTFDHELHRAMREQVPVEFEAYSEPTERWLEVRVYPTDDGLAGYSHDITERKRAEEELSRYAEHQALVAELGQRSLASDDLDTLMNDAVALVARTLDVQLAAVAELPVGSDEVIFRAGVGWREGIVGSRIERGARDSQVGYTLLRREPVIAEDQSADPRFKPSSLAQAHGVVSALTVMIASPDEPFGVLGALSTRERAFPPSDVSFVQAVANVLAGAVERTRAHERLDGVREAERRRIARALHDEALQELTDAAIQVRSGSRTGLDAAAAGRLVSTLEAVSLQLRVAIYDLRLSDEENRPFPGRLRALVASHRVLAVDCDIGVDIATETMAGPLGERGTEVLRIVAEALTNARRHSGARHVHVRVRGSQGRLSIEVADDGRGFDPAAGHPDGDRMGIRGMRERAAQLDGDLDIRSSPATGTMVRLKLGRDTKVADVARILLVEDHTVVREAIAGMLSRERDLEVVGQAASLAEARPMLGDVDVAVVDLALPDGYGGDLIAELREANPRAQALVLSASLGPAEIRRARESGAADTLDKTADFNQLLDSVRRLHAATAGPS